MMFLTKRLVSDSPYYSATQRPASIIIPIPFNQHGTTHSYDVDSGTWLSNSKKSFMLKRNDQGLEVQTGTIETDLDALELILPSKMFVASISFILWGFTKMLLFQSILGQSGQP